MGNSKFDEVLHDFWQGDFDESTRFVEDLGMDSLNLTGLIQELEEAFGVMVTMPNPAPSTVGELRAMFEGDRH